QLRRRRCSSAARRGPAAGPWRGAAARSGAARLATSARRDPPPACPPAGIIGRFRIMCECRRLSRPNRQSRSLRKQTRAPVRPVESLTVDVGDFSEPMDPRQKVRSECVVRAMGMIHYDAVGLGVNELNYNQEELLSLLTLAKKLPYTAANLHFVKPGSGKDMS